MASLIRTSTYGKIEYSEQEKLNARRKTRKRIVIISLSSIVLVGVVVAAVFGSTNSQSLGRKSSDTSNADESSIPASLKAVCDVTLFPNSCYGSLSPSTIGSPNLSPEQLFKFSLQVAIKEVSRASLRFSKQGVFNNFAGNMTTAVLENCRDLLGLAIDHLNNTMSLSSDKDQLTLLDDIVDDIKTWLSSAGTYQQTCIDGFEEEKSSIMAREYLRNATELTSNSLAIITKIADIASSVKLRRLMSYGEDEAPEWFQREDRRMLLRDLKSNVIKVHAVVAKDGSGDYKTISAALGAVPDKSNKRFVIHVKKGVYMENVRVEKSKWNVMMFGDGMDKTVVSGSLNVVDGTPTFSTATFAVFGKGFVARDMGFKNTAGPKKHQAVALMSNSDQSIFYRCHMDAFQDTLYSHANRQFYRECTITGTVDFIFGNSAVVLQNCIVMPRLPMQGQQNTITAQGKIDPNQNTGISIHNCTITPAEDLGAVRTYLGRPWKAYSTTIYLRSRLGGLIDPTGWMPWDGVTAPPDTIFYAEYQNFGHGASTKNRVKWKGLKNLSIKEANKFTVKSLLKGDKWIAAANVNYNSNV